jgi:hypothetical protein
MQDPEAAEAGLLLACLQDPLKLEQLDGGAGAPKLMVDLGTGRAGAKVTAAAILLHIYTLQ